MWSRLSSAHFVKSSPSLRSDPLGASAPFFIMSMPDTLKGLTVEIIRIIWDYGYLRGNTLLNQIHAYWFDYWVEFKTQKTMSDVDRQIEEIREPSGVDAPIYTETKEGSTALGGEMRLSAPWTRNQEDPES